MLTKKEQSRIQVLNGVIAGEVTADQGAALVPNHNSPSALRQSLHVGSAPSSAIATVDGS